MNVPKSSLDYSHFPVMLREVIKICSPKEGGYFVDCTFGGGSYSKELLKFPKTKVIALDRDKIALQNAQRIKDLYKDRFIFFNEKFSNLENILIKFENKPDTIIFDLGVSSLQLKDMSRGFSFKSKAKLDMSMGLSTLSAEEVINNYDEHDLKLIIKIFGDEKEASKIARNIIKARKIKRISTVSELVKIIEKSKKKNYNKKINICTKTFQALRIFVNKETTELIEGIIQATKLIKEGGKIIIISFHSIEDKIVKFYFSNFSQDRSKSSRYLPEKTDNDFIFFENYKNKFLQPTKEEILENPPSRSAKLRFVTRNKKKFDYPEDFKIKFKKYLDLERTHV
jgi:16S rRNA (cytosine1402-N4)-methyltransferase